MIEKVVKTTQQMFRDGKENGPTMDSEGQPSRTRNSSQMCRKIGSTEAENGSVSWNHFGSKFWSVFLFSMRTPIAGSKKGSENWNQNGSKI